MQNRRKSVQGDHETVCGPQSRAAQIASRGIRTTGDVKNLGLALAEDILGGELSHKVAGPVCRSVTLTIRTAEFEQQHGGGGEVFLGDSQKRGEPADHLRKREMELEEELAAIRKERAAVN